MHRLAPLFIVALLFGCGGGGGSPAAPPEPELGIVYISNQGTQCYDCLEVYTDGVLTDSYCGVDPLCPGETADTVVPLGHYYDLRLYQSTGPYLVDFPTFFMDSPTWTLVIVP